MNKKLVIIYNADAANQEIADEDKKKFFLPLSNDDNFRKTGVKLDFWNCQSGQELFKKIQLLLDEDYEEYYLHFSGHGQTAGIPYGDWVLQNNDLVNLLDESRIKFCFFSSCQSGDLVQLLNTRNIPVVIGTQGKNNLTNQHAIAFQNYFYQQLSEKKSFLQAFEKAKSLVKVNEDLTTLDAGDYVVRGGGVVSEKKAEELNDLQLAFADDSAKNAHLIFPSIVDHINYLPDHARILLVYANQQAIFDEFYEACKTKGYHSLYHIFFLSQEALVVLNKKNPDSAMAFMRGLKVLFILSDNQIRLAENPYFIALFNKKDIYNAPNLKFRLARKTGVAESTVLGADTFLMKNIKAEYLFNYDNEVKELLEKKVAADNFIKFLDDQEIDLSDRRKYTLQFHCTPIKREVEAIKDKENYLRVFFATQRNENLINFIVNFVRFRKEIKSPNLIFDFRFENQEMMYDEFTKRLRKTFPELSNNTNWVLLSTILSKKSYTFIFRTQIVDEQQFFTEVKKILKDFQLAPQGINKAPAPSYLFFINNNDVSWNVDLQDQVVKTKQFSPPDAVTKTLMEKWRDGYCDEVTTVVECIKKIVEDIDPEPLKEECPSEVIALVCEGFIIPRKQILHLS